MKKIERLEKFLEVFYDEEGECLGCATKQLTRRTNHEEVQFVCKELYDVDIQLILDTAKKFGLNVKFESVASESVDWEDSCFIVLIYP